MLCSFTPFAASPPISTGTCRLLHPIALSVPANPSWPFVSRLSLGHGGLAGALWPSNHSQLCIYQSNCAWARTKRVYNSSALDNRLTIPVSSHLSPRQAANAQQPAAVATVGPSVCYPRLRSCAAPPAPSKHVCSRSLPLLYGYTVTFRNTSKRLPNLESCLHQNERLSFFSLPMIQSAFSLVAKAFLLQRPFFSYFHAYSIGPF